MSRPTASSALLVVLGGLLALVALPLRWSGVSAPGGGFSVALRGVDYAGYDIATTVVIALLLLVAAACLLGGGRRAALVAVTAAVLAGLWAALVYAAAANPTADGRIVTGVDVSVGPGAYVLAAGSVLALIGAALSFRGARVASAGSAAQPSV